MTHSTLTSFCASRQPSRQPSEPLMSARLSLVPEPFPSQVPESIIKHDEAINLMPPGCQQGSPPDPNNTSDSSFYTSQQGKPYGTNPAIPANLAYPVNPLSNLTTLPANPASLLDTPPAILIQAPHLAAPQHTKIHEPNLFNGSNPKKLQPFLVQLELNFCNWPNMCQLNTYKVNYMLSLL